MRILSLVLILVLIAAFAWPYEGNTISVSLVDRPVYELLEILKEKGGLTIVYSKERLTKGGEPVTINLSLKNMPLAETQELMQHTNTAVVKISKEGYHPYTAVIQTTPDQTTVLDVTLTTREN